MRLLLASLFFVSFSAFANDIIRVTDGSAAYCKTKADVLRYQSYGVYRPLKFERTDDEVKLTVEFLRCVKKGENYGFVRDTNFEERTLTIEAGPFSREETKVSIDRSEVSAVAFSSQGRVYHRATLEKNADNTYSQSMPVEMANFEADRNGEHFFEMAVSYKVKVTNQASGQVIDQKLEYLGAYRIYVK